MISIRDFSQRRTFVRRYFSTLIIVVVAMTVVLAFWLSRQQPNETRPWAPDQARMPRITIDGSRVTIDAIRDFPPDQAPSAANSRYIEGVFDLDQLDSVWFVLVPFGATWRGPAHSFISFGFSDGRYLAVSVEARRERDDPYRLIAGMLRQYELIYVIGEERDLIGRRVMQDGGDVYLYRMATQPASIRTVLLSTLRRADQLRTNPEFYNTVTNSCTSNLIDQVNGLNPGSVRWDWRQYVPGYADELALELGLLDTTESINAARARYRINREVSKHLHAPDFSARIRADQ